MRVRVNGFLATHSLDFVFVRDVACIEKKWFLS